MARLAYVVTAAMTANHLLRGQLRYFAERGYDVTLVTSPSPELAAVAEREGVAVETVAMSREVSVARDARSLAELIGLFRRLRPDIVNASTPKAGLLGMMAAATCRVPTRIYVVRGLRLQTATGIMRGVLSTTERVASACASHVVCVSDSLRGVYERAGYCPKSKISIAGPGSSNGVDAQRFSPSPQLERRAGELRSELGLADEPVIGFVGRLTRDKGVADLLEAFDQVPSKLGARLLVVGDHEHGDPVGQEVSRALARDRRIVCVGAVLDPAPYYQLMHVLAFPSAREGFPNAPLEAAASGVPTVGYRVTGTVDAIEHERTGWLVPAGDAAALGAALARYCESEPLRRVHGDAARERATTEFRPQAVWSALDEIYRAR